MFLLGNGCLRSTLPVRTTPDATYLAEFETCRADRELLCPYKIPLKALHPIGNSSLDT